MNQFVQIPCGKCGTTVWISPAAGVGYCPQCHSPNQLPAGAAGAAAPAGAPQPGAQPGASPYGAPAGDAPANPYGGGGMSVPAGMTGVVGKNPGLPTGKIIGAVAGAVGIAILGIGGTIVKGMLKGGEKSVSSLGIEEKKADPDKMITAVAPLAKSWKGDAVFWSVNVIGLGPDGTVDLSKSDSVVTVEYISPSRVTATLSKMREDSIKKFNFNGSKVRYADKWNATNQWQHVSPTPVPGCSFKQIGAALAAKGLKAGHTAHVSLDPQFGEVIHAMADDPHIDVRFDPATCKPL